jgi:signal transduction histidine kinase
MLSAILEAALCRETIEHAHTQLQDEFVSLEEQNQFKTDLLNMASHEVRHPLTLLMGFSEVLNDYYSSMDSSEMLGVVRKIGKSAERLKRRVANLLELSRIESGRMELGFSDVDLEPLLREISEELELENPGHHIYINLPVDFPRLRADREKLEIVLFNLIENSIKYSPSGGNIQVKGRSDSQGANIQIIDEGIGIDAEDLAAIFKPFRRGTEKVKTIGMGLGLYIVDTIVKAHGGSIAVESKPGYGSAFTIRLDLA